LGKTLFFLQFIFFILLVYEFAARYFTVPAGKGTKDDGRGLMGRLVSSTAVKQTFEASRSGCK
jgi:hypothetical protein